MVPADGKFLFFSNSPVARSDALGKLFQDYTEEVRPGAFGYSVVTGQLEKIVDVLSIQKSYECFLVPSSLVEQLKSNVKLIVFDLDSTLIQQETIDELAKHAGVFKQVQQITQEAMEGKWDFSESLQLRVSMLKGINAKDTWQRVLNSFEYSNGVKNLFKTLKTLGIKTGIVSGGFYEMVNLVAEQLGADYWLANELEVDENGHFTGQVKGNIVDARAKKTFLESICSELSFDADQAMAIGDGANDILMMQAAGISIAFHAKDKVRQAATLAIDIPDMNIISDILQYDA